MEMEPEYSGEDLTATADTVSDRTRFDDNELQQLRVSDKQWQCPVESCRKILSRKQTLKTHIAIIHNIQIDDSSKTYKLYDNDPEAKVPRTTAWRRKSGMGQNVLVENTEQDASCTVVDMELDEDSHSKTPDHYESINQNQSAPLYIIKCNSCPEGIHHSSITKQEHELAVLAYAARHNVSDTGLSDLLALINLYLPESNLLDTNISKLKEKCGFNGNFLNNFIFCNICKNILKSDQETCITPDCPGQTPSSKNKSFFMTADLTSQLKNILIKPDLWGSIQENAERKTTTITDITDGEAYLLLKKEGNFLYNKNNITLTLFTDGVPLFKSSGVSMWPVYLLINEVPRNQRFRKKNMLLWGVWQGTGKPMMTVFLKELIKDLSILYTEGFTFSVGNTEITSRVMLIVATMDLQARAAVLKMTQHNGEFACVYCLEKGKQVASGKGHCKAFPFSETMTLRTSDGIREDSKMAQAIDKNVNGFLGESVLLYLTDFQLNKNIVIDYMHGILLGITKKFMSLWFDSKYSTKPYNIGKQVSTIDKKLIQVTPPHVINRLPRKISLSLKNWKASELRAWLLFYSLPCLQGTLHEIYLKHFALLVEATYILLTEGITDEDTNRANHLLNMFVQTAAGLYAENIMGLNMHNLLHLTKCVKQWGPMWAWSCFSFESFNGEIKKTVHGTGNVCLQIFWALMAQKHIEQAALNVVSDNVANFIRKQTKSLGVQMAEEKIKEPCGVKKTFAMSKRFKFRKEVKDQLHTFVNSSDTSMFVKAKKITVNGFSVYSKNCTKVKKRNSYTVLVSDSLSSRRILEIEYFLVHKDTSKVFAVGRKMKILQHVMNHNAPHLQVAEYVSDKRTVEKATAIQKILVSFKIDSQLVVAELPNTVEGD